MHPRSLLSRVALAAQLALPLGGAIACRGTLATPTPGAAPDTASVMRDVRYLASDALEGRGTGTAGNDSAAAYIARRLAALGLRASLQPFQARAVAMAHAGRPEGVSSQNVVAILPGRDRARGGEYLVSGAHYDHLGRSPASAQDPEAGDARSEERRVG